MVSQLIVVSVKSELEKTRWCGVGDILLMLFRLPHPPHLGKAFYTNPP